MKSISKYIEQKMLFGMRNELMETSYSCCKTKTKIYIAKETSWVINALIRRNISLHIYSAMQQFIFQQSLKKHQ